jgi:dTDP-4-amino-4,6-dideoxygalactose transaminase
MTNDAEVLPKQRKEIRHHGITRDRNEVCTKRKRRDFTMSSSVWALICRMSDIHAALGGSQLRRLDEFVKKRRLLAKMYLDEFSAKSLPIKLPLPDMDSAWHLYSISCYNKEQRDLLFEHCYRNGIGTAVHYAPVYAQPWYTGTYAMPEMRDAEGYTSTTLSLPLHPALNYSDIVKIVDVIAKFN